jgi:hypothetical protein
MAMHAVRAIFVFSSMLVLLAAHGQEPPRKASVTVFVIDAARLISDYDSGDAQQRRNIEDTVHAMEGGMGWANLQAKQKGQAPFFCAPYVFHPSAEQLIDLIRHVVKNNPDAGKEPWELVLLLALEETYPCQPK